MKYLCNTRRHGRELIIRSRKGAHREIYATGALREIHATPLKLDQTDVLLCYGLKIGSATHESDLLKKKNTKQVINTCITPESEVNLLRGKHHKSAFKSDCSQSRGTNCQFLDLPNTDPPLASLYRYNQVY